MPVIAQKPVNGIGVIDGCVDDPEPVQRIERQQIENAEREIQLENKTQRILQHVVEKRKIGQEHRQSIQRIGDECEDQVRQNAGNGYPDESPFIVAEIARIDRDGFRPSEPDENETDEPDNVEMRERIERISAVDARRIVAALYGGERVREFVERQDDHDRQKNANIGNDFRYDRIHITPVFPSIFLFTVYNN
mgnify:FL=1